MRAQKSIGRNLRKLNSYFSIRRLSSLFKFISIGVDAASARMHLEDVSCTSDVSEISV
jgi:hypothetical protein